MTVTLKLNAYRIFYMIFYIFFLFLLVLSFLFEDVRVVVKKRSYNIVVLILIVVAGGRYCSGADYESYKQIFESLDTYNLIGLIEPFFGFLMLICKLLIYDYNFFLVIIAVVSILLKVTFINKYSPYSFYSLCVYFAGLYLVQDMGQIRQGLAIGICWFAFIELANEKKMQYASLILLATFIHFSAFICFILYFLRNFSLTVHRCLAAFILCIACSSVVGNLLANLDVGNSFLQYKFNSYIDNDVYGNAIGLNWGIFLHIFILLAFIHFYDKIRLHKNIKRVLVNAYFIGNCIYFLCMKNEILAGRLSLYFFSIEIMLIPMLLNCMFSKRSKKYALLMYSFILLYFLYNQVTSVDNNLSSYKNIFFI